MKKQLLFATFFSLVALIVMNSYSGGPASSGAGDRTGRPGGSGTCASCHGGGSFGGSISFQVLDANNNPVTQFTGGQSYTLQVTLNGSAPKHGFQLVAVKASSTNSNAGSLSPLSAGTQVTNLGGRDYAEHSSTQNSNTFSVSWQAPSAGFGDVRFYVSGLLANGNFGTSGDQVVNSNFLIPEFSLPPIVITGSVTNVLCASDASGAIQVNVTGGQSPYTYSWNTGSTSSGITGLTPGSYSVTVTDALGSTQNNSFTVTSTSTASLSVSTANSTICQGDSTVLTASNAASYLWSTGETTASILVNPSTTQMYSVTATFADGCTLSAQSQVVVNQVPTVSISALTTTICEGGSVALNASGANSYSWSTNESGAQIAVAPTTNSTYFVTGTNSGCSAIDSVEITVNQRPTVSIQSVSGAFEYCEGSGIFVVANGAQGYVWNTAATTDTIFVDSNFDLTVEVIGADSNGCTDTASAAITVNPLPQVAFSLPAAIDSVCEDSSEIILLGGTPTGGTYSGSFVTNGNFNATAAGLGAHELFYSYTDALGCSNSASTFIEVINCVNSIEEFAENGVQVYPNPFKNELTIQTANSGFSYKIMGLDGRVVAQGNHLNAVKTLDLAFLNSGSYVLIVETEKAVTNSQITKY